MASARDEIMGRTGPEDNLTMQKSSINTSAQSTAGLDWDMVDARAVPLDRLDYKPDGAFHRHWQAVTAPGPQLTLLSDLASSRNVCAKTAFNFEVRPS
jgi:hypothetical protein